MCSLPAPRVRAQAWFVTSVTTLAVLVAALIAGPCVTAVRRCRHGAPERGASAPGGKPPHDHPAPDVPAWLVAPALVFTAATVVLAVGSALLVIVKRTGDTGGGAVAGCSHGTYMAMVRARRGRVRASIARALATVCERRVTIFTAPVRARAPTPSSHRACR